jgi:hypothetical protein
MFVDNINRNLKRGRIVLILAGDGIREDAESLVDLVQDTAGARQLKNDVSIAMSHPPERSGAIHAAAGS